MLAALQGALTASTATGRARAAALSILLLSGRLVRELEEDARESRGALHCATERAARPGVGGSGAAAQLMSPLKHEMTVGRLTLPWSRLLIVLVTPGRTRGVSRRVAGYGGHGQLPSC